MASPKYLSSCHYAGKLPRLVQRNSRSAGDRLFRPRIHILQSANVKPPNIGLQHHDLGSFAAKPPTPVTRPGQKPVSDCRRKLVKEPTQQYRVPGQFLLQSGLRNGRVMRDGRPRALTAGLLPQTWFPDRYCRRIRPLSPLPLVHQEARTCRLRCGSRSDCSLGRQRVARRTLGVAP